jgi:hypothetical protein
MAMHNGSSSMAHNLDRFSFDSKHEQIAADAARLNVSARTVRMYLDWYGEQPVTVISKRGTQSMPAFEAQIRWQQLGEKVRVLRQMELSFPAGNQYAYERRGW